MEDIDALLAARATSSPANNSTLNGASPAMPSSIEHVDPLDALLSARAGQSGQIGPLQSAHPNTQASRDAYASNDVNGAAHRMGNYVYGAVKGAADLVQAPAQLVINGAAALSGDGPAGKWVKDKAGQFNTYLGNQEKQYQADTPGSLSAGIGRISSGIVPFLFGGEAPVAVQTVNAAKSSALARQLLATSATSFKGALYGMGTQPVNDAQSTEDGSNNFFKKKAIQGATSAVGSVAALPVGAALSRMIKPNTGAEVRSLMDQGVTPTPGQILGSGFAATEDKLTSVPILGDMIKNAQRRTVEDFNRTAYNRALSPLGMEAGPEVGRDGVLAVKTALGNAYDSLLPKLQFKADPQFSSEISNLTNMLGNGNVKAPIANQFNSILKNEVFARMTKQGSMDGQSFKNLEESLGKQIKNFKGATDPDQRTLGDALQEVLNSARGTLTRTNPQFANELQAINEGYANYTRIRAAGASSGAPNGVFTPAQLAAAVRSQDKSAGKGNFATGTALMQDLSDAGKSVMPKYPDSGTIGRGLAIASGPTAAAFMASPLVTGASVGAAGLAMAPYTPMGQKMMAALLAKRPAIAEPIARGVKSGAPLAGMAVSPALLKMLVDGFN